MIDEEQGTRDAASETVVRHLLQVKLIDALRTRLRLPEDVRAGLLEGLADPQLRKAIDTIHADLSCDWTISRLADAAGLSRSVFAKRFNARVGMPPIAYLTMWRFIIAKQALRQTMRPISEIASDAGYASTSAFSNAFRAANGVGPGQYRTGEVQHN